MGSLNNQLDIEALDESSSMSEQSETVTTKSSSSSSSSSLTEDDDESNSSNTFYDNRPIIDKNNNNTDLGQFLTICEQNETDGINKLTINRERRKSLKRRRFRSGDGLRSDNEQNYGDIDRKSNSDDEIDRATLIINDGSEFDDIIDDNQQSCYDRNKYNVNYNPTISINNLNRIKQCQESGDKLSSFRSKPLNKINQIKSNLSEREQLDYLKFNQQQQYNFHQRHNKSSTKFNNFFINNNLSITNNSRNIIQAQCNESIPISNTNSVLSNLYYFIVTSNIFQIIISQSSKESKNKQVEIASSSSDDEEEGKVEEYCCKQSSSYIRRRKNKSSFVKHQVSHEWNPSSEMPSASSNSNRYQTIPGTNDVERPPSRKSSLKVKSQRLNRPDGYSRLNHNNLKPRVEQTFCQDFKRLILLAIIISVCCLILWQIYQVLLVEYNYLGIVKSPSKLGQYKQYAVSTDAKPCAKVGTDLLAIGGSAVDAAVGTLICMGVVIPNSLGIGGGGLITIYHAKNKTATVIDGRETAPDYANETMFAHDPLSASRGPLSVGIPGELAALFEAHKRFGKLKWSQLFNASIEMAEFGNPMVEHLSFALRSKNHAQYIKPELAKIYTNPKTGQYYSEGDIFVQKELAETLKRIRDRGAEELYGGLTGQLFIEDLKKQGGKMTLENLKNYKAEIREPLTVKLDKDLNLYTTPLPGSGIVLSVIMRIMKKLGYYKPQFSPQRTFEGASLYYHRLAEAFKFAYAQRAGLEDFPDDPIRMKDLIEKLSSDSFIDNVVNKIDLITHNDDRYGGNEFFSDDHGTAHVSVIDGEGNAVAITSSVNLYFGSGLVSPSTGITYNDVMDDFVSPNIINKFKLAPSKYNHIKPGRRPISSMAPSIFTDSEGNVKLVIGASGGTKITTSIASVSLRNLYLNEDIKTAIDGPRIHHQFLPNQIYHEQNFPKDILLSLTERGHMVEPIKDRSSIIMAIANSIVNGTTRCITANSDYRKGGTVDGL